MAVLICCYLWIIYSLNTYNGDFYSYYVMFDHIKHGTELWHFEPAFAILMQLCVKAGIGYIGFKSVIGVLYIVLVYTVMSKYSEAPALALSAFMVFPFLHNVSVVRGGLAGIIVCLAFCHYATDKTHNKLKFIAGVAAATLFHYSSVLFIFFLFIGRIKKTAKVFLFSAICAVGLSAFVYSGLAFRFLSIFTSRIKSLQWLSTALYPHLNLTGMITVALIFIVNYWISARCFKVLSFAGNKDDRSVKLASAARTANCALFVILPFALMTDVLLRYIFEFMAVNICVMASAAQVRESGRNGILHASVSIPEGSAIRSPVVLDSGGPGGGLRLSFDMSGPVPSEIGLKVDDRSSAGGLVISVEKVLMYVWVFMLLMYTTLPYLGTDISAFKTLINNLIFNQPIPFI